MNFSVKNLLCLVIINFPMFAVSSCAQIKPDVFSRKFAAIGYRIHSSEKAVPTIWETEQFQMLSKTVYRVKRTTPLSGTQRNLYPRFEVIEEFYADEKKAEIRNARIDEKPPNLPIEKENIEWFADFSAEISFTL